jgi:Ca-activated chloride channel homolog
MTLDPKLTSYALGELDPSERSEIEAELARRPELAEAVREIEESAALVSKAFAAEEAQRLDEARRRALLGRQRAWLVSLLSAVAVLMGTIAIIVLAFGPQRADMNLSTGSLERSPMTATKRAPDTSTPNTIMSGNRRVHGVELLAEREFQDSPLRSAGGGLKLSVQAVKGRRASLGFVETPLRGETYRGSEDNAFLSASEAPSSTFSIDVDTASYSNVRRMILAGEFPPREAVRIEEMINYFEYRLPPPTGEHPFAFYVDVTDAPWNAEHLIARIALKGREIPRSTKPRANLVFLVDVSGSMKAANRLALVKESLTLLLEELDPHDRVAIVVYAGAAGLVLPSTPASNRVAVARAIASLEAGGSTDGGSGIQLAYEIAQQNFVRSGANRVILATDGDFNVGMTDPAELQTLISKKAKSGVFLTVLGYGMENYQDATLEILADKGNGNYAYIDRLDEARKVLVEQLTATLVTIAKDVKIQVVFNPLRVASYRLIGYENRVMPAEHFDDDTKDAGEIGAGHEITALYELEPAKSPFTNGDLFTVKLRYKLPDRDESRLIERTIHQSEGHFAGGNEDLRFAAAVAAFGMLLRDSPYMGSATFEKAAAWARGAIGADQGGRRSELADLIDRASRIDRLPIVAASSSRLDPSAVMDVVRAGRKRLSRCYAQAGLAKREPHGKLEFLVTIEPNGSVSSCQVRQRQFVDTPAALCLRHEIQMWRFPPFDGDPQQIVIPFVLERRGY